MTPPHTVRALFAPNTPPPSWTWSGTQADDTSDTPFAEDTTTRPRATPPSTVGSPGHGAPGAHDSATQEAAGGTVHRTGRHGASAPSTPPVSTATPTAGVAAGDGSTAGGISPALVGSGLGCLLAAGGLLLWYARRRPAS